ncbi:MAG: bifunctional glutamate N-acetyltransferase/amino-acid acetyltransferase ArgJ [Chloroflexi bacterium]|nr:bifunctional glutamate N-acetyltransferase/amino-acid acetyltransferase ArgJ [Chloroflexota bacterium]
MTIAMNPTGGPHVFPQGFMSAAKNVGIRDATLDFTVVYSTVPCNAASLFTQSRFAGAPIIVGREHVADGRLQAVVVNSKNANVATGPQGVANAREICALVAGELGIAATDVLPSSTGVIGRQLPMERIRGGIVGVQAELRADNLEATGRAIMTTDTRPKMRSARVGNAVLFGMCKGVGMIEPNMATMLAYFYTDAAFAPETLREMLRTAAHVSFNMVSVDTDTSTSDTCALLANGLAGEVDRTEFQETLTAMARELAQEIARDGEGATKLIEAQVRGARDEEQARTIAKVIVNSPLIKTAVYGADPNWGRVAMAVGKCSQYADLDPERIQIAFGTTVVYDGRDMGEDLLEAVKAYLQGTDVVIGVDLRIGGAEAVAWGCDLTEGYVEINGKYST